MNTSETIGKIATALALAQAELKNPSKGKSAKITSKTGKEFSYQYADFATALDNIRPILSKAGIAFTQATSWQNGVILLDTRLIHGESGEWIEGTYPVCGITAHREMGSALSYARRYALLSLIGVQGEDEDDDGAADERSRSNGHRAIQQRSNSELIVSSNVDEMVAAITQFESLPNLNAWARAHKASFERLPTPQQERVRTVMEARRGVLSQAPTVDDIGVFNE